MNKRRSTFLKKYRPALFAGLYFFHFLASWAGSQEYSSLQLGKRLLSYEPENLLSLPDSSEFHICTTFDPLYTEHYGDSGGGLGSAVIRAHSLYTGWFSHFNRFNYFLSCRRDAVTAEYRKDDRSYTLSNRRNEWNIATGFACHHRNAVLGLRFGRHWPKAMEREHLSEIDDHFKDYLMKGPWQLSLDARVAFSNVAARLSLYSGPVHSSISEIVTSDKQSYRMFPVSIIRRRVDAGVDIHTGPYTSSTTFGIDHFVNADLQTVRNGMPQDIAINNYRLAHNGTMKLTFTDSLRWLVSGSTGGGWVASYNFNRDRFTFFKSDAVRMKNITAESSVKLPFAITTGVFLAASKVTSPSGFLRLSALSTWSVFKPIDYRYDNAEAFWFESGGAVNRKWSPGWGEFTPQVRLSYVSTRMVVTGSQKEVVVLLPVYVDPETIGIFRKRLLLMEPSVAIRVQVGCIALSGSVHQIIPFLFAPHQDTPKNDNRKNEHKVTGGTMLAAAATWLVPEIRK